MEAGRPERPFLSAVVERRVCVDVDDVVSAVSLLFVSDEDESPLFELLELELLLLLLLLELELLLLELCVLAELPLLLPLLMASSGGIRLLRDVDVDEVSAVPKPSVPPLETASRLELLLSLRARLLLPLSLLLSDSGAKKLSDAGGGGIVGLLTSSE